MKPGDLVHYDPPKKFFNYTPEMKHGEIGVVLLCDDSYAFVLSSRGKVCCITKYLGVIDEAR